MGGRRRRHRARSGVRPLGRGDAHVHPPPDRAAPGAARPAGLRVRGRRPRALRAGVAAACTCQPADAERQTSGRTPSSSAPSTGSPGVTPARDGRHGADTRAYTGTVERSTTVTRPPRRPRAASASPRSAPTSSSSCAATPRRTSPPDCDGTGRLDADRVAQIEGILGTGQAVPAASAADRDPHPGRGLPARVARDGSPPRVARWSSAGCSGSRRRAAGSPGVTPPSRALAGALLVVSLAGSLVLPSPGYAKTDKRRADLRPWRDERNASSLACSGWSSWGSSCSARAARPGAGSTVARATRVSRPSEDIWPRTRPRPAARPSAWSACPAASATGRGPRRAVPAAAPRRICSSWARAAICWANSAVWMPWNSPSSQPTSWAWAIRSSASVGTSSSVNGRVSRSSSSTSSGASPSSSSLIEAWWIS